MRSQPIYLAYSRDKQYRNAIFLQLKNKQQDYSLTPCSLHKVTFLHDQEDHACLLHSGDHPTPALQPINPPLSASP